MSSRINGYVSEREYRPSSEQMSDLHVYLVPPNIWREKFNNALNTFIDDTISLGFIRVHPETRVSALRDEIEQQLGSDLVPREYVFVKSVGRSLTRLKARQENTLKVKNFLPPQAYAPELYLLEATPELKQAFSEGSTRPETRTSYDYDLQRQSVTSPHRAKYSNSPPGAGYPAQPYNRNPYPHNNLPLPQPQSPQHPRSRRSSPQTTRPPPTVTKTVATPRDSRSRLDPYNQNPQSSDWEESDTSEVSRSTNNPNTFNRHTRPPRDLRNTSNSDPSLDPSQHQMVGSSRRGGSQDKPTEEYRSPLSATPPHSGSEKTRAGQQQRGNRGNRNKPDDDSGIAGFSPETYRENHVLDRRKHDSSERDGHQGSSPDKDESDRLNRSENEEWERQQQQQQDEERERREREEEERRRREEEEERRRRQEEEDEEERRRRDRDDGKMTKTSSEEDLTRYPSPPPLRLASPDRDTTSARTRRKQEKEELMKELERAREARKVSERQREELVKHAKQMQSKTTSRRNHARDLWKKRYFDEKKKTNPLEEQCNRLRHELDIFHKKLLTTLEGPKEKATKLGEIRPSNKNNFKIQATRLQHEIEDIRRRVDHAKMKLTSEMKNKSYLRKFHEKKAEEAQKALLADKPPWRVPYKHPLLPGRPVTYKATKSGGN